MGSKILVTFPGLKLPRMQTYWMMDAKARITRDIGKQQALGVFAGLVEIKPAPDLIVTFAWYVASSFYTKSPARETLQHKII